jgi:hypothetical protein
VWNLDACIDYLAGLGEREGGLLEKLLDHAHLLCGSRRLEDDFSVIEARFN